MRLARAKSKSLEEIPADYFCCDARLQQYIEQCSLPEFVIDLDQQRKFPSVVCRSCGQAGPSEKAVYVVSGKYQGWHVIINHIDIAEGVYAEEEISR